MAAYGYDKENAENLPEEMVASEHLMNCSTPYAQLSADYMTETVTRLLLAKNRHLVQDKSWQLAQEENKRKIQDDLSELSQKAPAENYHPNKEEDAERGTLVQNYLDKMVIMQDDHAITDETEMREWVKNTFHFSVSDIESENAFIYHATNNGYPKDTIAFTSSILKMMQTSEQFEGVIAHELGHYFVGKIYPNKYISPSMNERLADKHALDCLYYTGQDPNSYAQTFAKLYNLEELSETDKLNMAAEAHDSPISRIKNIRDYNEAVYGTYMQDYLPSPENETQNQKFQTFKKEVAQTYKDSRYISKIEELITQDSAFSTHMNETTGRVDFSQIPYEKTIDKLIELTSDSTMRFAENLADITEIIAQANQQEVTYTPELSQKLSTLVARASDNVYIQEHQKQLDNDLLNRFNRENKYYASDPAFRPLSYDIYTQSQKEDMSLPEIAEKLEHLALSKQDKDGYVDVDDNNHKKQLSDFERQILRIHRPQSPLLTETEKNNRTQGLDTELSISDIIRNKKYPTNLDKLITTITFPNTDIEALEKEKKTTAYLIPKVRLTTPGTLNWMENEGGIIYNNIYVNARYGLELSHFSMPKMEEAVGQQLPWADKKERLEAFGLKIRKTADRSALKPSDYVPMQPEDCTKKTYSLVRFPDNKPYEFLADDNGKIIAVGANIAELQKQNDILKQKENNQKKQNVFETRLTVLNNLTALAILDKKSQTAPLSDIELKKQAEITRTLTETPNLEPLILFPEVSTYIWDINNPTIIHLKEHAYEKMPLDAPEIADDYNKFKSSLYYKYFMKDTKDATTAEEQRNQIAQAMQLNTGENTLTTLRTLFPTIEKILDKREQNPEFKETHVTVYDHRKDCLITTIEKAVPEMTDAARKLGQEITLSHYTEKFDIVNNLEQFHHSGGTFQNDSQMYIRERSPYYEKIREIYKLPSTDNNPEQLYANLSATVTSEEELGAKYKENDKYGILDKKTAKTATIGSPKLNCNLQYNENKVAEYEVMRYLNNPQNTEPLDVKKLVTALPKYEAVQRTLSIEGYSSEFKTALSDYIFNKSDFKQLSFEDKRDIYEQLAHKNMINRDTYDNLRFQEDLKKSYEQLPEEKKQASALSMLKDSAISYQSIKYDSSPNGTYSESEKTDTFSKLPIPEYRNFFITEYGTRLSKELGKEPIVGSIKADGTQTTEADKLAFDKKIVDFMNMVNTDMTQSSVKDKLFEIVADNTEVQQKNANLFNLAVKHVNNENDVSLKTDLMTRGTAVFEEVLDIVPQNNVDMINFLNTPYSEESQQKLRKDFADHTIEKMEELAPGQIRDQDKQELRNTINNIPNEDIYVLHKEFWDKDIKTRAALTQRLLNNYCGDDVSQMTDFLVDKYIEKDHPYYQDTKNILNALYARQPETEPDKSGYYPPDTARFMIGAMLSAKEPSTDKSQNNMGIGEGLALFCSNNGPAWVKFGQALSNIPNLPDDIRKPLSVLKDKAVKLPRWELYDRIEANLPQEKLSEIKKVGKLLGAGSFFSSVAVEYPNDEKHVVQFMQPNARKDADREFSRLKRTISQLSSNDEKYAVLGTIVDRAKESTKTEVDIKKGYDQYTSAEKNYNRIESLEVNGVKFNLNLLPWVEHTQDETNGTGYKEMEFAKGKGLSSVSATPEEKRILAAGYITSELGILLSGKAWDIDRHSGQQNFDIIRDEKGSIKEVNVGIFDTGAIRPAPNAEEKKQIAGFYANVLLAVAQGEDMNDVMFKEVQKLEEKGKDASYVSDIQRGSIALLGMMEYQTEEKDTSGHITTPARSLSGTDLLRVSGAIVKSGMVDHAIIDPMMTQFVKEGKEILKDSQKRKQMAANFFKKHLKEKVAGIFRSEKQNKLEIKMNATGILEAERKNSRIDQENNNNPQTNPYDISASKPQTKTEHQEQIKANKLVRNLQAVYIKHTR